MIQRLLRGFRSMGVGRKIMLSTIAWFGIALGNRFLSVPDITKPGAN